MFQLVFNIIKYTANLGGIAVKTRPMGEEFFIFIKKIKIIFKVLNKKEDNKYG